MGETTKAIPDTPAVHLETLDQADNMGHLVLENEKYFNWRVLMNLIIVGSSLGLFGYDNAFASPLVSLPLFVEKYQGPLNGMLVFSARNLDLIICVPIVGGAVGSLIATPLQKVLGRKWSMIMSYAFLCTPGAFLQLFAPNISALVVGRFWNAAGVGLLASNTPIYLSELVLPKHRARSVGFTIAATGAMSVIATTVVWASAKYNDRRQYQVPMAVQAAAPVVFGLLSLLIVESPSWLVGRGRIDEARQVLLSIMSQNIALVETELIALQLALQSSADLRASINVFDIFKREHIERTLTSGAPLSASQVGGQILTGTYATVILVQSGVADPFKMTIIIFMMQFVGALVGPPLVDKVGRRPVALVGFSILFIIDIAAGSLAAAGLTTSSRRLALASLCIIFGFFNSAAFQSIAYLIPTEVPTSRLREPTLTWTLVCSYSTAIITTFAVPQITNVDGANLGAKAFLIFGGCMAVTIVWTYFFLPETANRSLAEIDEMYAAKIPKRHWKNFKTTATTNAMINKMDGE